jgi:hypothetical protein
MSKQLETLNLDLLSTVTGGQNSETTDVSVPVPGTNPIVSKGGTRSDYAYCVDTVKGMGGNFNDIATVCGQPPAPVAPGPVLE